MALFTCLVIRKRIEEEWIFEEGILMRKAHSKYAVFAVCFPH